MHLVNLSPRCIRIIRYLSHLISYSVLFLDSDLDSRFRIIGTGSLQIDSAKETDSGEYQCRAINSEDSLDATASLQVQVPPRFRQRPSDKKAQAKDELDLVCEIDGKPTPSIQWLKNGQVISPSDCMQIVNGHNLRILGLLPTDSGMYQCVGSNPAGTVQASAQLQIVTPGIIPAELE